MVIAVLIGLLGYFLGGLTVHQQLFPFEQLRFIKNKLLGPALSNGAEAVNTQYPERRTQYETFSPPAEVVMIGDSITQGGLWDEMFPHIKIANRGIGWDKTNDILLRMGPILAVQPKKAFVMVGINDLAFGRSVPEILENYVKIIDQLQSKNIATYIQSTLECSKTRCGDRLSNIRELNRQLKAYAGQKNITYIDINAGLTSHQDGLLSQYTYDGIHLLATGYSVWRTAISQYIQTK